MGEIFLISACSIKDLPFASISSGGMILSLRQRHQPRAPRRLLFSTLLVRQFIVK
jgi:hypothetical protein